SSNHKANRSVALVALSDEQGTTCLHRRSHQVPIIKVGNETSTQNFYKEVTKRYRSGRTKTEIHFKGVKQVLKERKLWHDQDRSPGRDGMVWQHEQLSTTKAM
ncbi:unnamed protein product, partial [Absidia cylindrospora]